MEASVSLQENYNVMNREDKIIIAEFCGESPYGWLPNYDTDWNALMKAISKIEDITRLKFAISRFTTYPNQTSRGYDIEKTGLNVLKMIKKLNKKNESSKQRAEKV